MHPPIAPVPTRVRGQARDRRRAGSSADRHGCFTATARSGLAGIAVLVHPAGAGAPGARGSMTTDRGHGVPQKMTAKTAREPDAADVPVPGQRVSFKIHRLNAKLALVANRLLRERKIEQITSRLLVFLAEAGEARVGQLVDVLVLPQSTISHQLLNLERRGLITRTRAQDDNRSVAVTLTDEGRRIAAECEALSRDVYLHMVQSLSEAELGELSTLLDRLFVSLEDYSKAHDDD